MKSFLLIPDSFKGTMSSEKVCSIMEQAIKDTYVNCNIVSVPIADGGEGTVNSFVKACQGAELKCTVYDPYFNEMEGYLGLIDEEQTAIIEVAACCGFMQKRDNHNIETTSTYGVGQLIDYALNLGVKRIVVGLGGSITNDGGCGLAAALGIKFYDYNNQPFIPLSGNLKEISRIDTSSLDKRLNKIKLTAMCDINNPLFGENGAAYVFSPQKGASPKQVKLLDEGLRHLAEVCQKDLPYSDASFAGAGAAGGIAYGMKCFLNAKIQMGIQAILDAINFKKLAQEASLIFTGEGKMDAQSLSGKAVIGIAKRAKKLNKRVVAVVGSVDEDISEVYKMGITAVFCTNRACLPFEKAKLRCEKDLYDTMKDIITVIHARKR